MKSLAITLKIRMPFSLKWMEDMLFDVSLVKCISRNVGITTSLPKCTNQSPYPVCT